MLESVRASSSELELHELLKKPTTELLGVSAAAAAVLANLGIKTIFDLGTSNLFASARAAMEMSQTGTPSGRFGIPSADLLTDTAQFSSLEEIPRLGIDKLRILSPQQAQQLSAALDVMTIRDLALWPPYISARKLIGEAVGSSDDPEDFQTEELRPRFGQYPTERVYYNSLVMLQMLGTPGQQGDLTGPVSLGPAVQTGQNMTRPAVGALLTLSQSWYSQGITLGHMLHSLALAPGEATRIAIIDWSRRTRASATEVIAESEQLDSASLHVRALSEVQQAVANDFQAGGSRSSSLGFSGSRSYASSSDSGLLGSIFGGGGSSTTEQSAYGFAYAESSSWSLGNRSVLASMTQNVNDRTEQHSSSVRNRRATAVREVSQSEHEEVSTRVVANYNHMHALTVQYYEVVQIYRTVAQLHRADRCLFIPMELLDFSLPDGMKVVERFRGALVAAALNKRIRSLLTDDTTAVEIRPVARIKFSGMTPEVLRVSSSIREGMIVRSMALKAAIAKPSATSGGPKETEEPHSTPAISVGLKLWDNDALALVSRLVDRPLIRPDSDGLHVPDDTEVLSITFDNLSVRSVRLDHVGSGTADNFTVPSDSARIDLPRGLPMIELDSISVSKAEDAPKNGLMTLFCSYMGRRFSLPAIPLELSQGTALQKVVNFLSDQADRRKELLLHLQNNRDYYSRAVYQSLDSATLTLIFSRLKWNGKPLIDQVEPRPVRVAGNYLVLRAPVENSENSGVNVNNNPITWKDLLKSRGIELGQQPDQRIIPIPTDGVFAEAVLGRSNSAEKLDITRFWNWQDSPIPLSPPEISAIQAGTRATPEDLKPGQLSPPVLNIVNPTALPAPDSISAVLGTLSNLNFRDMSGLAGTQGLASAAMQGTLQAATEAGRLASENMKTQAQKTIAMGQIAADIAKAAIGAKSSKSEAGSGGSGASGISGDGARINHGRSMDSRGVPGTSKGNSSNSSSLPGPGPSSGGESNPGTGGRGSNTEVTGSTASSEYSHESAYADQGAFGYSPDAVGALTAAYNPSSSTLIGGSMLSSFCAALRAERDRWLSVKQEIVRIANDEFASTWSNGTRTESEAAMQSVIRNYWSQGVYDGGAIPGHISIPASAWSAAFIAWVVFQAGGGGRFSKFGSEVRYRPNHRPAAHWRYLSPAKFNKENGELNPFWGFRINEVRPEVGDIIVRSRSGSGATYENFDGRETHGDIVVEVRANDVVVIGGNAGASSDTVARRNYPLDTSGFIQSTGGGNNDHFAIIRIVTDMFDSPMCRAADDGGIMEA
jgi:hypothetical protein